MTDTQKNKLKPWLKEQWCIPPKQNALFVYHLEDVLRVYRTIGMDSAAFTLLTR